MPPLHGEARLQTAPTGCGYKPCLRGFGLRPSYYESEGKNDENELSMYRHPRRGDILLRMRKDGELSRGFGAALRLR